MKFSELVSKKIPDLIKKSGKKKGKYEVFYEYLGYNEDLNHNSESAYYNTIKAKVTLRDTETSESVETFVDLLYMPVQTELGYRIGKSNRQILGVSELNSGWFVLPPKEDTGSLKRTDMPKLRYKSITSRLEFYITAHEGKLTFSMNKNGAKSCPLEAILKVLSGKSSLELIHLLGESRYFINSFNRSMTNSDAYDIVRANETINIFRDKDVSNTSLYEYLSGRFFAHDVYDADLSGRQRYKIATSFSKRALNQVLAEPLSYYNEDTKKRVNLNIGEVLTKEHLSHIDLDSSIDTLYIEQDTHIYCLKKYPVDYSRLTLEEMYTMINLYVNVLDGYGGYDAMYDQTSRVVVSYGDRVLMELSKNLTDFSNALLDAADTRNDMFEDLRVVFSRVKPPAKDSLIKTLKSSDASYVQTLSNTNLLNMLSVDGKIVTTYKGTSKDQIGVQEYERNRNDPIDQPESDKIGKVFHPTLLVKSDAFGFRTAPYIDVKTGEIVYLTATEEESEYIAPYEEDFSKPFVKAYQGGSIIDVPKQDVRYKEAAPHQSIGVARSCIPFQEFNNSKRLLMGSNHQKQAVYTLGVERPLVSTGLFEFTGARPVTAHDILHKYYSYYGESLNCTEEEFYKLGVRLTSTSINRDMRVLHFAIEGSEKYTGNGLERVTSVNTTFIKASDVKSIFSNRVIPKPNNVYTGDDIIYHNINIDISNPEIMECTDYGAFPPESYKNDLALGVNLLVGYKTWEGSTIDDAIVLRKGLCYDGTLTSVYLDSVTYDLYSEENNYFEEFGITKLAVPDYILSNGLPKIGTVLFPGDMVMCKKRIYVNGDVEALHKYLDADTSGEVVSADIDHASKTATVVLAKFNTMEPGDKMAGRYGNKGVVGKVVPDEDMPYIAETGEILDVILNPLGIPSRMNLGQALEIILGRAAQLEGKCCVISPFNKDTLDFMKQKREEHKIYPKTLIDGRTGEPFERPVEVGVQYMLSLYHKVKTKHKSVCVSRSIDQSTGQATSSTGAQAIGEMETWAFEVTGCNKILQDFFSFHADDYAGRKDLEMQIESCPDDIILEGDNHNNLITQAVFMTMGIKLGNRDGDGSYKFDILRDSDIIALAPNPLNPESLQALDDERIFGSKHNKHKYNRNFGYVEFGCEMVNPYLAKRLSLFSSLLVNYKNEEGDILFTTLKEKMRTEILDGTLCVFHEPSDNGFPLVYPSSLVTDTDAVHIGIAGFIHLLKLSSLERNIEVLEDPTIGVAEKANKVLEYINFMKAWQQDGYDYSDFITHNYPVLPMAFRASIPEKRQYHDLQILYKDLFVKVKDYRLSPSEQLQQAIYVAISAIIDSGSDSGRKNKKGILSSYFGKNSDAKGKFREQVLKKRVNFSGRSVIIPSQDVSMDVTHIGIPVGMAFNIWRLHLRSILNHLIPDGRDTVNVEHWEDKMLTSLQTKNFYKFRDLYEKRTGSSPKTGIENIFQEVKNELIKFLENQVILAGRQPTLHQYGIRAYKVRIVEHRCIQIHALTCSGYNADFDGDTMYTPAVLTKEAQKEAMEKLSMKQSIVNPKDGESIIKLSQDMLLGIYTATMLYDNATNLDDKRYQSIYPVASVDMLNDLVDTNKISVHDLVTVMVDGRAYISTAGRVLFNSLLPDGFTPNPFSNTLKIPNIREGEFYDLRYDGLVSKKGGVTDGLQYVSASKIMMDLYNNYDIDTTFDAYQKMMEFGFKFSDRISVTLGVTDFYSDIYNSTPGTIGKIDEDYIERCKKLYAEKEKEINLAAHKGYISQEAKSRMLQELGGMLNKRVQDYSNKALPRNNNLFIVKDSGARGNAGQIGQTVGMAGMKMKTLNSSFDIPVMHSYAEGLNTYEMSMDAFASRQGVASTQLNTADAGYALRQMVYMANGLKISEDDCGAEAVRFEIEYDKLYRIKSHSYDPKPSVKFVEDYDYHVMDADRVWEHDSDFIKSVNVESGLYELLVGKKIISFTEHDYNYLKHFMGTDYTITRDTVSMILKKKIKFIYTEDCVYELNYTLTPFYTSYLQNRFIEMIGNEVFNDYSTVETVKYIEDVNPRYVYMRTLLNCKADSCCKKCYGLKYATDDEPKNGEMIGIEAAQAIGEPVTQLTMSLFHQGGAAGKSVSNGVELNTSLLGGRLPKKDLCRVTLTQAGHVSVNTVGNNAIVVADFADGTKSLRVDSDLLVVKDGEYVDQYTPITAGFSDFMTLGYQLPVNVGGYNKSRPDAYVYVDADSTKVILKKNKGALGLFNTDKHLDLEEVQESCFVLEADAFRLKQQLELLKLYHWNFSKEDINVFARHFELFVKVQTNTIKVVNSNLEGIESGNLYNYIKLKKMCEDSGGYFLYPLGVAKQTEVVLLNSGPLSSVVFERVAEFMDTILSTRQNIPDSGFISKLVVGESLVADSKKTLTHFTRLANPNPSVVRKMTMANTVANKLFITETEPEVEAITSTDFMSDSWFDTNSTEDTLFDFDDFESSSDSVKKMDIFGD